MSALRSPGADVERVAPRDELRERLRRVEAVLRQWAACAPNRRPPPTLSRPSLLQLRAQLTAELARLDARAARRARSSHPRQGVAPAARASSGQEAKQR